MNRPPLLAVVQRYGEVTGGAESLARMVATRLAPHFEVEVATTTSRDYWEWDNSFPAGESREGGIVVRRFPVARRRARDFKSRERAVYEPVHAYADEEAFIEAQGPYVPELLEFLHESGRDYDHVLFFTYLYYPTVRGLPLVPERAVLVPTAHDELALRLGVYKLLFHAPRAIVYLSEEERAIVQARFHNERVTHDVVGAGVDVPSGADGRRFRQRHGIEGPMLLYAGRLAVSKSSDELLALFTRWRDLDPVRHRATLVLIGHAEMPVPQRKDVRALGYLSEEEKFDAYAACDVFVTPSRFESLSIVGLEALASAKPVLCHADCDVLRGLVTRAGGGLYYRSFAEFSEILELLLADAPLRKRLGASGRRYVEREAAWPRIVEKYLDLLAEVRARNA